MKSGKIIEAVLKNIATLGYIGYMPIAPGTWGSLAGLLFVAAFKIPLKTELLLIAGGIVIGSIASGTAEAAIGEKDSGHIIIDEFVGMMIACVYLPHTFWYLMAAFLLFRFFDILKPFPVRYVEHSLKGGIGVMSDDIVAGIMANGVMQIWNAFF